MFPFLIGTVRTIYADPPYFGYEEVSIPHRYGKNPIPSTANTQAELFPFLIGTVRTNFSIYSINDIRLFPFLIGTVRTQRWLAEKVQTSWFPFLIGTVRTFGVLLSKVLQLHGFHSS